MSAHDDHNEFLQELLRGGKPAHESDFVDAVLHGGPRPPADRAGVRVTEALDRVNAAPAPGSPDRQEADAALDAALDEWHAARADSEPPPPVGFDGGARAPSPPPPPSLEAQLLGGGDPALTRFHQQRFDGLRGGE